ncbi:MAG: hypothetical protein RL539_1618, partial [Pseudomonadota bacterium]
DPVGRRERALPLLHGEAFRMVGEIRTLSVKNRLVITTA